MIELDYSKIHFVSNYLQTKLENEEWKTIHSQISSYILKEPLEDSRNLNYPGFFFSDQKAADIYFKKVYSSFKDVYTPPRGNLSKNNNIILSGIKPGNWQAHLSKCESAWIFGPSSKMLHKLLKEFSIYPYFTNFYKSFYDESNNKLLPILKEITVIAGIYKTIYNQNNLKIVCLGNYSEYDSLKNRLDVDDKILSLNMNITLHKIWHPSYLLRAYTDEKFAIWKENFKIILAS